MGSSAAEQTHGASSDSEVQVTPEAESGGAMPGDVVIEGEVGDPGASPAPRERRYDPEPVRDQVRGWLALATLGLLAGNIAVAYLLIAFGLASTSDMKDLVTTTLTPVVALAGTVLGFYFGGRGSSTTR